MAIQAITTFNASPKNLNKVNQTQGQTTSVSFGNAPNMAVSATKKVAGGLTLAALLTAAAVFFTGCGSSATGADPEEVIASSSSEEIVPESSSSEEVVTPASSSSKEDSSSSSVKSSSSEATSSSSEVKSSSSEATSSSSVASSSSAEQTKAQVTLVNFRNFLFPKTSAVLNKVAPVFGDIEKIYVTDSSKGNNDEYEYQPALSIGDTAVLTLKSTVYATGDVENSNATLTPVGDDNTKAIYKGGNLKEGSYIIYEIDYDNKRINKDVINKDGNITSYWVYPDTTGNKQLKVVSVNSGRFGYLTNVNFVPSN